MATKLAMPAPLAKSAILSGVDRPGLGEGQLRADSPLLGRERTGRFRLFKRRNAAFAGHFLDWAC